MGLIIWMDKQEAELIRLTPEGIKKEKLVASGHKHPAESLGHNHPIQQTDEERFYHKLASHLEKVSEKEWFIASQGPARDHFINHLEKHHPQLMKHLVGSEKIDKMNENQIVDLGMKFFRHLHAFQSLRPS